MLEFLHITNLYCYLLSNYKKKFLNTIEEKRTATPFEFLLPLGNCKASTLTKQQIAKKNNKTTPATETNMQ